MLGKPVQWRKPSCFFPEDFLLSRDWEGDTPSLVGHGLLWSFPWAATYSRGGRTRDRSRRVSDRPGDLLGPAYLPHPGCKRPPLNWLCTGLLPPQVKASRPPMGTKRQKLEGVTTLPFSLILQRCRRLRKKGRGKVSLWQLGENQIRGERSEKGKKMKLSSLRLLPICPCYGARQGLRLPD